MDWTASGLKDRIQEWLEATAADRYARERRLDPFATSMRDFDDVSPNLKAVRAGSPPGVNDSTQRTADLRAAGLLSDTGKELSPLGEATLAAWEKYGVDSSAKGDELARLLLLVLEGKRVADVGITTFLDYWGDLRTFFDPMSLISNWDTLYTLNYLDFERVGFRPGDAFRDQKASLADVEFDLLDYAVTEKLGEDAVKGATRIEDAIGGKVPRGRHRATFAIALEIATTGAVNPTIFSSFGFPQRPRTWAPFNETQKSQILAILADYAILPATPAAAVPAPTEPSPPPPQPKPQLPVEIDFSAVLVGTPAGPKAKVEGGSGGTAPKKVDHQKKAERDSHVGRLGEEFAIRYERWRLREHPELLKKLRHVSETDDTLGYDIESYELDGSPRFVEVKATLGPLESRFFLSANEVAVAQTKGQSYVVLRVGNLEAAPICCEVRHPFQELVLTPASYEVTFAPAT
jgi:hypothetical protein